MTGKHPNTGAHKLSHANLRRRLAEGAAEIESYTAAGTWSIAFGTKDGIWSPGLYALLDVPSTTPPTHDALMEHVHPDDRAAFSTAFRDALAEHRKAEHVHRILTGGGATRTVLSRAFAKYDDDTGEPAYAIGTMVDITNNQLVRRKLDDATAQLMAVWEHVQEGLLVADMDGTIVDCNPFLERLCDRGRDELIGTKAADLRPPDLREAGRAFFAVACREPVRDHETFLQRADGTQIPVEISTSGAFRVGTRVLTLGTYRDISARKQAETAASRRAATEARIARAVMAIVHATERDELLRVVCAEMTDDLIVLATFCDPVDDAAKSCRIFVSEGTAHGYMVGAQVNWDERSPFGNGAFGQCVRTRRPALTNVADPAMAPWRERAEAYGIVATLALPIIDGDFIGVLILHACDRAFDEEEIAIYESLAGDVGLAWRALVSRDEALKAADRERDRAVELEAALEGALTAVSTTLEKRDPYTAGHQRRVAELARIIADELGVDPDRTQGLYLAALVHDIGKIAIPSEILTKPGRLNEIEFAYVKQHAQYSADIVRSIPFRWPVTEIVLQHHEYLDGSGYPRGLTGDQILLEARILTVADIVESMTAVRPYHVPAGIEGALAEIRRLAHTKLDPLVVDAAVRVIEDGAFARPILLDVAGAVSPVD